MKSMVVVWTWMMKAPGLKKEEREKTKRAQGKGNIYRAILFSVIKTL